MYKVSDMLGHLGFGTQLVAYLKSKILFCHYLHLYLSNLNKSSHCATSAVQSNICQIVHIKNLTDKTSYYSPKKSGNNN